MEDKYVFIHGEKWAYSDIEEDIEWAKTNHWSRQLWKSESAVLDHEHCQICWWTFYCTDKEEHGTAFKNEEGNTWVCTECYERFISIET
ncbi:hypothetical protein PN836_010235 [Ningiella sp. W23]|uniref:hypothetical protein n=1 Tax=Ningiella sp. W23 TaxID=3023715 RepID=UPI0037573678